MSILGNYTDVASKLSKICALSIFAFHSAISSYFFLYLSFHNLHYSLPPPDVPTVSPTRALFFICSLPIPPLPPSLYSISICLSPIPQSHSLRQGGSCEGDLSKLNYTLHPTNYLSDCSQVSLHCFAFGLNLSIRPLFCGAFIIFTQPCALSFINVNTHRRLFCCTPFIV